MNIEFETRHTVVVHASAPNSTCSISGALTTLESNVLRGLSVSGASNIPLRRSCSLPENRKSDKNNSNGNSNRNTKCSQVSYEFEKIHESHEYPHDTEQDKKVVESFQPRRQCYFLFRLGGGAGSGRGNFARRLSMPTTAAEKRLRFLGSRKQQQRQGGQFNTISNNQRSSMFVMSSVTSSAFERKRKQQEMEEGRLYAATKATESATQSWRLKTKIVGRLSLLVPPVPLERHEEKERKRESILPALLEQDANRYRASLAINDNHNNNHQNLVPEVAKDNSQRDNEKTGVKESEPKKDEIHKTKTDECSDDEEKGNGKSGHEGYELSLQIDPQAIKEQKVLQKRNARAKQRTQVEYNQSLLQANKVNGSSNTELQQEESQRQREPERTENQRKSEESPNGHDKHPEQDKKTPPNKATSDVKSGYTPESVKTTVTGSNQNISEQKDEVRKEQMRLLKIALKDAAASKKSPFVTLVSLGETSNQQQKKPPNSKRHSIHAISTTTSVTLQQKKANKHDKKMEHKHASQRFSDTFNQEVAKHRNTAPVASKKNLRDYMVRRSSAPCFASTVAALTQHGNKTSEEALKEMFNMPSERLAGFIARKPEPDVPVMAPKGSKNKKTPRNRRSSMPTIINHVRETNNGDGVSSHTKTEKRSSAKKTSRRASMPVSTDTATDVVIYDWALAAKQRKEEKLRNKKSGANNLKKVTANITGSIETPEGGVQRQDIGSTILLPKVEAHSSMVETKLREDTYV